MSTMETKAHLNNFRMSPRKVRLVTDLIKGMPVEAAIQQLQFSRKHAARPVMKLLQSAVANAMHNHQADRESLMITSTLVNSGATLHRWMPRAMGRATPIRKRTSHVTIVLSGTGAAKAEKPEVVEAVSEETTETKAPAKKPRAPRAKKA